MTRKIIKILALIPSDPRRNNRQSALRTTWIYEASYFLRAFFIFEGTVNTQTEHNDEVYPSEEVYDGKHISRDMVETLEYIYQLQPEWLLFCDDLAYLWIAKFIKTLDTTDKDVVGYTCDEGEFYFIREELLKRLDPGEKDVVKAVKSKGVPIHYLQSISHPLLYPKKTNNIWAVLGTRPDKTTRFHYRRDAPHIAVITIALGKYDRFFAGWYEAVQYYFLQDCTRHYYVFTDNPNLTYLDCGYCSVVPQTNLGWPGNTRDRFDMCLRLKQEIEENFDYVFFLQATARLIAPLTVKDCIPNDKEGYMWVTRNVDIPFKLTYDPNPRSTAYIPKGMGRIYVQGGAYGGRPKEFFQMCEECSLSIRHNRDNGIAEFLNDESHLNHYFLTRTPKEGWLRFLQPPDDEQAQRCKIYTLNKTRFGGFKALKKIDGYENLDL